MVQINHQKKEECLKEEYVFESVLILKLVNIISCRELLSEGQKEKTHSGFHGSFIYLLFLAAGSIISDEELMTNMLCIHKFEIIMTHFLLKFHCVLNNEERSFCFSCTVIFRFYTENQVAGVLLMESMHLNMDGFLVT